MYNNIISSQLLQTYNITKKQNYSEMQMDQLGRRVSAESPK
jgi:hypothetical protein